FVELHKGRIEVQDSPLGGACFRVSLPRQRIGQEKVSNTPLDQTSLQGMLEELRLGRPKAPLPAAPGVSADRPRVLVVEDNPDMNRFVVQCLEREYEVATAFDGQQGLEQAQRFRPTLVLSDIMMPHVSGVEMIARLRQLPELRDTPVLLLSAKADEDLMVQLLDQGAQDYIVKPFVERELVVRVRNLVAAEQARQLSLAALAREQFAHQEVALQKQLLHSLFMQAPTLIAVLRGPNHVVELANPPISVAWGRKAENVVGRPLAEVVPELCDQGFSRLLDRVYQTGEAYLGRETPTRVEQSDGTTTTRYFNFVYSAFHAVDGVIDGVFVVASDVTDQVLAREQVSGLRDAAESANRAKDEFLAMLGHELRNPLSPIATALHLMKLRGDESNQRERTVIERQVEHLTRLVDDLLDVSRFARGRIELKRGLVDVADVVVKAIELASPLIEQRAHSLTVEVPRDCLFVEGDATRLAQVVSNLLTNAAKYTAPGGTIHVHGARHDAEIVLSVRDTGIGIAPDVLAHIFDLFVQERQALDRSQGGLGIGLSIVRSLVERHGGSVSARSAGTGHGSEFIVRLPAAIPTSQPLTPAADRASADAPQLTASQRILVVDDNEDSAAMLATVLATRGHVVRVAHDAPSALHVASGFQPEFAFLDIGLPVVDGYELAGQLRALPGLEHLRLAALTGYGQESDRLRSQQSGFQYHLVKPVDLTTIEAALRGT
ncbi:MAG: response regulator, partial [Polyangiales bacterium]